MHPPPAPTVLTAVETGEPSRPLITFYDDATGERTELSRATLANWMAKTANLLITGLGVSPGEVALVRLPAHWQTAAVLLGCWSAGVLVDLSGAGPAEVAFVTPDLAGAVEAGDVIPLGLAPLAVDPADFTGQVRGHADHFHPPAPIGPDTVAMADGRRHADLAAAARGIPAGARLLIDGDQVPDPVDWLVGPLVAGATIVVCRHLDPARLPARLAAERATPHRHRR